MWISILKHLEEYLDHGKNLIILAILITLIEIYNKIHGWMFPVHAGNLAAFILCRFCVGNHRSCDFKCTKVLSHTEDTAFPQSFLIFLALVIICSLFFDVLLILRETLRVVPDGVLVEVRELWGRSILYVYCVGSSAQNQAVRPCNRCYYSRTHLTCPKHTIYFWFLKSFPTDDIYRHFPI